ncbi:MAG: SUMF1/EgtB/PvdO family nonheme iron enzyme [Planctomycetes bacterium]|nr:SUMF1/EgtB/PvdO family nonheme iron enzyme [Planctomycetota bacterium]
MPTVPELAAVPSLWTLADHAYLRAHLAAWRAGRPTPWSRARLTDARAEDYGPDLYVPLDGSALGWFLDATGRLRRLRDAADADAAADVEAGGATAAARSAAPHRAPLAWWVSHPEPAFAHTVVVGFPGGGKTVFLTRCAAALAAAVLGAAEARAAALVAEGLNPDALRRAPARLPVPVLLEAPALAFQLATRTGLPALVAALARALACLPPPRPAAAPEPGRAGAALAPSPAPTPSPAPDHSLPSAAQLPAALHSGRYALLIDAWDEIAARDLRMRVLELLQELARTCPRTRVLLASRSAAHTGALSFGSEFEVVELQPPDAGQRRALIRHWVALHPRAVGTDPQGFENELLQALQALSVQHLGAGDGEDFFASPLVLAALCRVFARDRRLPASRVELYRQVIEYLCASRASYEPGYGRWSAWNKQQVLERLALLVQRRGEPARPLTEPEAAGEIRDHFRDEFKPDGSSDLEYSPEARANRFLLWTAEHTGLLEYRWTADGTREELRFRYREFRDYLAACQVGRGLDLAHLVGQVRVLLKEGVFTEEFWHRVVLLLGGVVTPATAEALRAAIVQVAPEARDRRGRPLALAAAMVIENRANFGGLEVVGFAQELARVYGVEGAGWPMRDRIFFLDTLGVLVPEFENGRRRQPWGDPRYWVEAEQWVAIPAGKVTIEGEKKPRRVAAFEMAWSPVTVQQFAEFLAAYAATAPELRAQWWPAETHKLERYILTECTGRDGKLDLWGPQLRHPNRPVVCVSWHEAMAYCAWRTVHEGGGRVIRLADETEWQLAAGRPRADEFPWGRQALALGEEAQVNWAGTGVGAPTPVGAFPVGNRDRLADLVGNVWELCGNWFDGDRDYRAARGGSWDFNDEPGFARLHRHPADRRQNAGLRVVRAGGTV